MGQGSQEDIVSRLQRVIVGAWPAVGGREQPTQQLQHSG